MKHFLLSAGIGIVSLFLCASFVKAATVTGPYSTGGNTTGTGPWTLDGSTSTFSFLLRGVNENFIFSNMTSLSTAFTVNSGEAGGGSPRLRVQLDYDNNGAGGDDRSISVYLGNSPSYTSGLAASSGVNYIGNNDAGRYDTSAFPLGSPFTTYSATNSLVGGLRVLRLGLITDGFGAFGQNITVSSIDGQYAAAAVPTPSAALGGGLLLVGLVTFKKMRTPKLALQ